MVYCVTTIHTFPVHIFNETLSFYDAISRQKDLWMANNFQFPLYNNNNALC